VAGVAGTTPAEAVSAMLRLAGVKQDDLVYDLGSGDGRIVIAAAREHGARGVGIDIDPARIAEGERAARAAGVEKRVRFVRQDLFDADIRDATVITLYLLPRLNQRLRPKLLAELKPGMVVSTGSTWATGRRIGRRGRLVRGHLWVIPRRRSKSSYAVRRKERVSLRRANRATGRSAPCG
jgi:ribosomal protein L11 methylase PrmA